MHPMSFAFLRLRDRLQSVWRRLNAFLLPPVVECGAMPWMSLLYVSFLVIPFLVPKNLGADPWLTLLSLVVFLPVYFAFYWYRGARRIFLLLTMAALGVALLPANFFSNSYLIYSNVLSAFLPLRQMLLIVALTQGAFAGAMFSIDPGPDTQFFIGLNLVTTMFASICNRAWLARARQNEALRLSQDEVQRLARVAERERIGRDLHDLLGHTLSVVALKAELAVKLAGRDDEASVREMGDVARVAREALGQVRRAVAGMRALGIRAELANARLALAAVQVDFDYRATDDALHPELETVLALALREATTNVIRHAQARRCRADLDRDDARVVLTIRDDGLGGAADGRGGGSGLAGMRERVAELGGEFAIRSEPGQGTELVLRLPWRAPPEPASESTSTESPRRLRVVR